MLQMVEVMVLCSPVVWLLSLFGVLHLLHPPLHLCVGSTPPSLSPFCLLPCSRVPWQSRVFVSVLVSSPDLFHVVLRYANWRGDDVLGRVSVIEDDWNNYCGNCEWSGVTGGGDWPFLFTFPQRLKLLVENWTTSSSLFQSPSLSLSIMSSVVWWWFEQLLVATSAPSSGPQISSGI